MRPHSIPRPVFSRAGTCPSPPCASAVTEEAPKLAAALAARRSASLSRNRSSSSRGSSGSAGGGTADAGRPGRSSRRNGSSGAQLPAIFPFANFFRLTASRSPALVAAT